ncbi:hypothetical protein [Vibrio diabolicus]|nr:hypothetical protein [Vibrio diabolicus]MDV5061866.1 hypothetical protein [Vibrio diabolicus]
MSNRDNAPGQNNDRGKPDNTPPDHSNGQGPGNAPTPGNGRKVG